MYYYKLAAEQGDNDSHKKLKSFNEEPLLTMVLTMEWPTTHKYLHPKCQKAIQELFSSFHNKYSGGLPTELIIRIVIILIRIWPKQERHLPLYISSSGGGTNK